DLYRLVVERFHEPGVVVTYAAVMLFLCLHLSHGFWSAFQSLGANNRRWLPVLYTVGVILSVLLAGGFFVLPIYTYFSIPLPEAAACRVHAVPDDGCAKGWGRWEDGP